MRHRRKTVKLGRSQAHRDALLANLACSLIEHHRIKTTVAKAKALRPFVEKLVTKARNGTQHDRRIVAARLKNNSPRVNKVVSKLFTEIAPLNANRPGGYTRIIKLGARLSDSAPMAFIEFVEQVVKAEPIAEPTPAKKATAKKAPAKAAAAEEASEPKAEKAEPKPRAKKAKAEEAPETEAPAAEAEGAADEEKKPARKPRAKKTDKTEEEK
jgi:large subunit ribosomal protein L17